MHDDESREQRLARSILAQLNGTRGELKLADLKSAKRLAAGLAAQARALEALIATLEEDATAMREAYVGLPAALVSLALPPLEPLRVNLAATHAALAAQEWLRAGIELRAADEQLARWRLRAPGSATHAVSALDEKQRHRTASATAGQRSGEVRRKQRDLAPRIRAEAAKLEASGHPARDRASAIAQRLGCDPSTVRKELKRLR